MEFEISTIFINKLKKMYSLVFSLHKYQLVISQFEQLLQCLDAKILNYRNCYSL